MDIQKDREKLEEISRLESKMVKLEATAEDVSKLLNLYEHHDVTKLALKYMNECLKYKRALEIINNLARGRECPPDNICLYQETKKVKSCSEHRLQYALQQAEKEMEN
jgi:hypothetical protein